MNRSNIAAAEKQTRQGRSLLDQYKEIKPEGGLPTYKFENVGDAVVGKFIARRQGIKTKMGTGNALDIEIIECSDGSTVGPHTIFESGHLTMIFDANPLKAGEQFYLRLNDIDRKS